MKIACVYDPCLLFVKLDADLRMDDILDIIETFNDHEQARQFFGFKIAVSDTFHELLATDPDNGQYHTWEIFNTLTQILLRYPEEESPDYCVMNNDSAEPFIYDSEELFDQRMNVSEETKEFFLSLLGACFAHNPEPSRVCFASGDTNQVLQGQHKLVDGHDRNLYITRSHFDWEEQYRLLRNGNARMLPNKFSQPSDHYLETFYFCPANATLREEVDDLPHDELNRKMLDRGRWQRVNGGARGYRDCWGNMWMYDPTSEHWDVQITDPFRELINATDYHINVQPAELQYPHQGQFPPGFVAHGRGNLDVTKLQQPNCPHGTCPRKQH